MADQGDGMKTLEELLQGKNAVEYLRNSPSGPNVYPGVPPEYTNWRDEQQAWQKSCVLFNLSFHMADLYVEGPDAQKLLSSLAINTFKNISPERAKQFVPCSHDGHVIGDVILFTLGPSRFVLVGRIPALNWIRFHAEKYDVKLELDERSAARKDPFGRKSYRFQIQGPNAMKTMEKALGKKPPEVKFFHVTTLGIAGKQVMALRHGMAGQPGFELVGPYAEGDAVRDAILRAGEEFGLRLVGGRAYSSNTLESGWIPSPLPAVYSGDRMKPYRQWLKEDSYEARASIGGSFVSNRIEDYYLTPWDMGYGSFIDFEHEFIGRDALKTLAKGPHRKKVTLALEEADVLKVIGSQIEKGERGKFIEFPSAVYSMHPMDRVTAGGKTAGISTWIGYSSNERRMLTIAVLEEQYAEPGTGVTLIWGEENGGTRKPTVERHRQMEIRAVVSPVPYAETARKTYADGGWRNSARS
jgi:glycine cleavage system aminomethyltransferase T